ncbi:thioredoxin [Aeropyrum pernix]|uniref:Thioredoxin n=2 Tax=Aeropyrum pernix TaxID=56636 RepID=A0A401H785_AERPX|nr:thioredoxin [Aeropyrum pernix]
MDGPGGLRLGGRSSLTLGMVVLFGVALGGAILGFLAGELSQTSLVYSSQCYLKSSSQLEGLVEASGRIAVMFSSETCPTCKVIEPVWTEICERGGYKGVRLVVIKLDNDTADAFLKNNVTGTPTFILFENGKELSRYVGAFKGDIDEGIKEWIDASLRQDGAYGGSTEIFGGSATPVNASSQGASLSLSSTVTIMTAFLAGFIAALSPCVLPVLYSYITGLGVSSGGKPPIYAIILAPMLAALGAASIGALFLGLGSVLEPFRQALLFSASIVLVSAGILELMGIPTYTAIRIRSGGGLFGFSLLYGVLSVQCSLPLVLGGLLLVAGGGLEAGLISLAAFSIGIGMPVAIAVTAVRTGIARVQGILGSARLLKAGYLAVSIGGVYMLAYSLGVI